jgi:hypothetical protein
MLSSRPKRITDLRAPVDARSFTTAAKPVDTVPNSRRKASVSESAALRIDEHFDLIMFPPKEVFNRSILICTRRIVAGFYDCIKLA